MSGLLSLLVATAASGATAQPSLYTLVGACHENRVLNGVSFVMVGKTLSGAPFYKGLGYEYYIYHDPDCMNSGDGTPRWIIDEQAPSQVVASDLDLDRKCNYLARIDSQDISAPPSGQWTMKCGTVLKEVHLSLLDRDANSSTTNIAHGESTHIGGSQSNAIPKAPRSLSGACQYHKELNGLVFEYVSNTARGSPFYKARGVEEYLYHDVDCDGSDGHSTASSGPKWVLDNNRPSSTLLSDLDEDHECHFHASLDAVSGSGGPPSSSATWYMFCGAEGWKKVRLTLTAGQTAGTDAVLVAAARNMGLTLVSLCVLILGQLARSLVA